jgi:hypothetical protein
MVETAVWVGAGVLLLLVAVYLFRRLHGRPKTLPGRWAARNGYVYRQDPRVHLFVQGPPFNRGDGAIERALLVGSCAGRPSLITHFGWYHGHPRQVGGASVALVLELPGEVAPLQLDLHGEGAEFDEVYQVTCESPELVGQVVTPRVQRVLMAGPHHERVNLRLDGTAMIVWLDGELVSARQLEIVHDRATELFRLIRRTVYAGGRQPAVEPAPVPVRRRGVRAIDLRGRPGEAWQTSARDGDEVSVSLLVDAAWPWLSIVAYEWMADQYHATSFDKPDPSAHPLVDIMFAVRSTDENFRRLVLADLADWLPIDERTRRCGLLLDTEEGSEQGGRITAYAPGQLTNTTLVDLLADVVHEVSERLSDQTYRYRPTKLAMDLP